jgi:hypothetical protein
MNHDMLEARRELLSERDSRERFALLAARPDWPPERREMVPGLTPSEAAEWKTFWREVDKRMWGEELQPSHDGDTPERVLERDPVQISDLLSKLTDEVRRGAAVREATLENALPVWRELHAAVVERMAAAGHRTDDPLSDWGRVATSLRDFDAQLTELRLRDAERKSYEPVPDPDGRPISPRERDEAEERLLSDHDRPLSEVAATPRPEHLPVADRDEARAAVERQNALPVSDAEARDYRLAPHESRLDWLNEARVERQPDIVTLEDRLDWLLPKKRDQPAKEPDRERDR